MVQTASFSDLTIDLRRQIDAALAARCQFGPGCPARLQEAMQYSLLGGGKRLRPLLVLTAAEACGCSSEA
ncbi:MAG: polyprenyl synthetase family protein, partial [Pirellulales bacterium]